jgi:hypothetical protein
MTPEYAELLTELHAGTLNNRVNWQPTSAEDQFLVYFQSFSVGVKFFSPQNNPDNIRFTMHDVSGKIIEQFWIQDGDDDWQVAWETYAGARRRARGIDAALQTILGELRSGRDVGQEPPSAPPEEDDEEVPF